MTKRIVFRISSLYIVLGQLISAPACAQDSLRDVKSPVTFPPNYFLLYLAIVVLLAALAALVIYYLKKRAERPKVPERIKAPWEKALEQLEQLAKQNLPSQGRLNEFYTKLSDIVRHYCEERFQMKAPEMTTEEFLKYLRTSQELNDKQKNALKDFLTSCDLVKFAKYAPGVTEISQSFDLAKQFINETKKTEQASVA